MKGIILAGGYGTRMYPLTKDVPKCLLPLGKTNSLELLIDNMEQSGINDITVITNAKFYNALNKYEPRVKVVNDGTTSNENRLGAIGDLKKVSHIKDDVLICASDYVIRFGFDKLKHLVKKNRMSYNIIVPIANPQPGRGYAIIKNSMIKKMVEKPAVPPSNFTSRPFYALTKNDWNKLDSYKGGKDNLGSFLEYLVTKSDVGAVFLPETKLYDIGNKDGYRNTKEKFTKR